MMNLQLALGMLDFLHAKDVLEEKLLRTLAEVFELRGGEGLHAGADGLREHRQVAVEDGARAGFHECPVDPMMMMITLAEVENNLGPPSAS